MSQVIRKGELVWLPWKNGAGEMADIAIAQTRTASGDPVWRVSTARVDRDSVFSHFPDVERAMMLIEGERLDLHVADEAPMVVHRAGPAITFAGDAPTRGVPIGGPIANLNVMIQRGRMRQRMVRWTVSGSTWLPTVAGGQTWLFVQAGTIMTRSGARIDCATGDTLALDVDCHIDGHAELIEVSIWPVTVAASDTVTSSRR